MAVTREHASATLLGNGRVLVAGGGNTVAPSTPSAIGASIRALVDGMGPFSRYLRISDAAFFALYKVPI
jgi:hypothetical protein